MRDPLTAQGWSKVLFIRGKDALPLLKRAGIEALLVNDKQEVVRSAGWPE
jgi:thiamine biosynthesis lipoprotein ApbE